MCPRKVNWNFQKFAFPKLDFEYENYVSTLLQMLNLNLQSFLGLNNN